MSAKMTIITNTNDGKCHSGCVGREITAHIYQESKPLELIQSSLLSVLKTWIYNYHMRKLRPFLDIRPKGIIIILQGNTWIWKKIFWAK